MLAKAYLDNVDVWPDVPDEKGVPMCSDDNCPSYDGKRCRLLGSRPDRICEPAVIELVRRVPEAPRP